MILYKELFKLHTGMEVSAFLGMGGDFREDGKEGLHGNL